MNAKCESVAAASNDLGEATDTIQFWMTSAEVGRRNGRICLLRSTSSIHASAVSAASLSANAAERSKRACCRLQWYAELGGLGACVCGS